MPRDPQTVLLPSDSPLHRLHRLHRRSPPPPPPIVAPSAMDADAPPFLPDPAQLQIPIDAFSAVSHALSDLAHTHPAQPSALSPELPSPPPAPPILPSSPAHIAHLLAALIRPPPTPPVPAPAPLSPIFTPLTAHLLSRELAAVCALAHWGDTFLPRPLRSALSRRLSASLCALVEPCTLRAHVPAPHLRPLPTPAAARAAVFRLALRKRYGSLTDAPPAMTIAGAPYVLYVHQTLPARARVRTPPAFGSAAGADGKHAPKDEGYQAWRELTEGVAVLEHVAVPAEQVTRSAVAAKLKDAVSKRALSPTLMVVDAALDSTLCAAADVLRAVCDTYGLHMHVEGDALPMVMAGDALRTLLYNVADLVRVAHSTLLDLAKWFGPYHTAVLLYCKTGIVDGESITPLSAPGDLSAVMSLWFLLHRVQFPRCADLIRAACEHINTFAECLYSVPHLIECKTVGCGASVLISYAAVDADAESRSDVNRAMLALFLRRHPDIRGLLALASHENREWVLFSPTQVLTHSADSEPCSAEVVKDICKDLVYAARRCELVVKGKAAFVSEMRQCQDVEVEGWPSQWMEEGFAPLFFAALRVTPFGEVARNGHWRKDEEMTSKVEKYTYALASLLQSNPSDEFEAVVHDSDTANDAVLVCIGPVLPELSRDAKSPGPEDGVCSVTENDVSVLETSATCAEKWDLDEIVAQKLALTAAESVTAVVHDALSSENEQATSSPNGLGMEKSENLDMRREEENDDDAAPGRVSTQHATRSSQASSNIEARFKCADNPGASKTPFSDGQGGNEDSTAVNEIHHYEGENAKAKKVPDMETEVTAEKMKDPREVPSGSEQRKRGSGIWGLLFGDESREDGGSSSSVEGPKVLEDDYFRL